MHLDRARLPRFVERLRLFGLRVGDAEIDLLLHRQVGDVGVNVTRREGDVTVVSVK